MKTLPTIYLAAEDIPGLAIGRKLIAEHATLQIHREENGRGYGTLKNKVTNYHQMASFGYPVLMITDLDNHICPSALRTAWLPHSPHPSFLFQVAIREVEAWILADRTGISMLLSIPVTRVPQSPETLADPKRELLLLAQRAPAKIRNGMIPRRGSSSTIGPEYNQILEDFIHSTWDVTSAASSAPSLSRLRSKVTLLAQRV